MPELPSGTVTFLFTDIEGSTKLWQQFPDAMPDALARHHEILQRAIETHNGYVFQIIGDAFCAAFVTAFDGLDAALAAQRALRDFAWGETGAIRVRMALHTGAAEVRAGEFTSGEYVSGITLSRAARLLSAGHGGQILLSAPTTELVREQLPQNIALRDMGAHRLKDLVQPQQIFQLLAPDLPQEFPALKTLDALPNNLPIQLTSFIGREREVSDIKTMLNKTRLLTLTGAGGSGKTRLSLQVAADVIDEFEKGAWFVEFAPIADASLVPNAVLSALELREDAGRAPLDALTDFLRAKHLLLILDNCEHLIEACAQLAHHLLTQCPNLKILATSREALGVAGEVTYQVPVLGLPDPKHLPSLEMLSQFDAVKLFIERAISVQPNFSITNTNAPAVALICYRLDGIPLAIELAAARTKLFSPEQIAARLDDRFRLLTGGSRTVMPRQQTLRAAIEWSYSLLSEQERILFRRLSVFAGGWTFEAAEQVCADVVGAIHESLLHALDILELLSHLVDKSLVTVEARGEETRYRMLETIHEYAFEKFKEAGESARVRTRHLEFYVSLAEQAEPHLKRAEQLEWLERLDANADNLRAALEYAISQNSFDLGARLATALEYFWMIRGITQEAYTWTERLLTLSSARERTRLRGQALRLASMWGEPKSEARELRLQRANDALGIFRELHDETGITQGLDCVAQRYDDITEYVFPLVQERLTIARKLNDRWILADALRDMGWLVIEESNDESQAFLEESLAIAREVGDRLLLGAALNTLQLFLTGRGEYEPGMKLLLEERELYQEIGFKAGVGKATQWLGLIALDFGDYSTARTYTEQAIRQLEELGKEEATLVGGFGVMGMTVLHESGNLALAIEYIEKSYALALQIGTKRWLAYANGFKGHLARHQGKFTPAAAHLRESMVLCSQFNDKEGVFISVLELGLVSAQIAINDGDSGQASHAARLIGAAEGGYERLNICIYYYLQVERNAILPALREILGEQEFDAAREEGHALTLEQAIELALNEI